MDEYEVRDTDTKAVPFKSTAGIKELLVWLFIGLSFIFTLFVLLFV